VVNDNQFLDPEEVNRIYKENGTFIRRIIKFHLGNSPDCDDVFQSFFLRLLEKPVPSKMINSQAYLYRMITNNIVDDVRRVEAYKRRISRYSQVQPFKTIIYDPYEKTAKSDKLDFIVHIIDSCLPAHIATALRLRYKENCSNDQIAQATSVKKATVIKRVSTGLKKLREILKRKHPEDD